jgi:hypothetical protein
MPQGMLQPTSQSLTAHYSKQVSQAMCFPVKDSAVVVAFTRRKIIAWLFLNKPLVAHLRLWT